MDEILRSRRLTEEIVRRAAAIQGHMDDVRIRMDNMKLLEQNSTRRSITTLPADHGGSAAVLAPSASLSQLPDDVLRCIAGCLHDSRNLSVLAMTCRRLRTLVMGELPVWRQAVRCEWGITQSDPSHVLRLITDSGTLRAMAKAGGVEVEEDEDGEDQEGGGSPSGEGGRSLTGKVGPTVMFDMDSVEAGKWVLVCRDRREGWRLSLNMLTWLQVHGAPSTVSGSLHRTQLSLALKYLHMCLAGPMPALAIHRTSEVSLQQSLSHPGLANIPAHLLTMATPSPQPSSCLLVGAQVQQEVEQQKQEVEQQQRQLDLQHEPLTPSQHDISEARMTNPLCVTEAICLIPLPDTCLTTPPEDPLGTSDKILWTSSITETISSFQSQLRLSVERGGNLALRISGCPHPILAGPVSLSSCPGYVSGLSTNGTASAAADLSSHPRKCSEDSSGPTSNNSNTKETSSSIDGTDSSSVASLQPLRPQRYPSSFFTTDPRKQHMDPAPQLDGSTSSPSTRLDDEQQQHWQEEEEKEGSGHLTRSSAPQLGRSRVASSSTEVESVDGATRGCVHSHLSTTHVPGPLLEAFILDGNVTGRMRSCLSDAPQPNAEASLSVSSQPGVETEYVQEGEAAAAEATAAVALSGSEPAAAAAAAHSCASKHTTSRPPQSTCQLSPPQRPSSAAAAAAAVDVTPGMACITPSASPVSSPFQFPDTRALSTTAGRNPSHRPLARARCEVATATAVLTEADILSICAFRLRKRKAEAVARGVLVSLLSLLRNEQISVQEMALCVLADCVAGDPQATEMLMAGSLMGSLIHNKLLDNRAPELMKQASRALANLWTTDGVPEVCPLTSDVSMHEWQECKLVSGTWRLQEYSLRGESMRVLEISLSFTNVPDSSSSSAVAHTATSGDLAVAVPHPTCPATSPNCSMVNDNSNGNGISSSRGDVISRVSWDTERATRRPHLGPALSSPASSENRTNAVSACSVTVCGVGEVADEVTGTSVPFQVSGSINLVSHEWSMTRTNALLGNTLVYQGYCDVHGAWGSFSTSKAQGSAASFVISQQRAPRVFRLYREDS